jgi:hypothetical protein
MTRRHDAELGGIILFIVLICGAGVAALLIRYLLT